MISLSQIEKFYPENLTRNPSLRSYLLKEYIQLLILDYLTTTQYLRRIVFIGGTCLRLAKGIDRFSEDLDFDCKNLSESEFIKMSDDAVQFLNRSGFRAETRGEKSKKLSAFRRNIYFPEFLFQLKLSGHREERFMIKLEAQDQEIYYQPVLTLIKGAGLIFQFPIPPDGVLCAMKLSAALSRSKGRDFYDTLFLLAQTKPDYQFLSRKSNINNLTELKKAVALRLAQIDIKKKVKDFEHLLFHKENSKRILLFDDYVQGL